MGRATRAMLMGKRRREAATASCLFAYFVIDLRVLQVLSDWLNNRAPEQSTRATTGLLDVPNWVLCKHRVIQKLYRLLSTSRIIDRPGLTLPASDYSLVGRHNYDLLFVAAGIRSPRRLS